MSNSIINLAGKEYKINVATRCLLKPRVVLCSNSITVFASEEKPRAHRSILIDWLKEYAKKVISKRTQILAERYGFSYKNVSIKDQSTRWGSCSSLKNLNFSWRLILAPRPVMDYVILHELSHTKQMNHSSSFWGVVESVMPNFQEHQDWLKMNGGRLMRAV